MQSPWAMQGQAVRTVHPCWTRLPQVLEFAPDLQPSTSGSDRTKDDGKALAELLEKEVLRRRNCERTPSDCQPRCPRTRKGSLCTSTCTTCRAAVLSGKGCQWVGGHHIKPSLSSHTCFNCAGHSSQPTCADTLAQPCCTGGLEWGRQTSRLARPSGGVPAHCTQSPSSPTPMPARPHSLRSCCCLEERWVPWVRARAIRTCQRPALPAAR